MHTLHRLFYLFTFYQNEYSSDDDDDDDGDEVIGVADNGCAQVGRIGSCRVPAFPSCGRPPAHAHTSSDRPRDDKIRRRHHHDDKISPR